MPPTTECPHHAALLRLNPHHPVLTDPQALHRLQYTPPVGLTQTVRMGTSASAGCTCGNAIRDDTQDIFRELDVMSGESETQPAQN